MGTDDEYYYDPANPPPGTFPNITPVPATPYTPGQKPAPVPGRGLDREARQLLERLEHLPVLTDEAPRDAALLGVDDGDRGASSSERLVENSNSSKRSR